ncbi:MAG: FecR domain-containing protein [Spirochaetia bacterium]|nr:FecR domain-containing protein [Spirochaetia bacterium]
MQRTIRIATGLVVFMGMAGLTFCGKPTAEQSKSMVVVYTSGEAKLVRAGQEMPLQVGMIVKEDDTIKTTDHGTVDLQSRSGSAVRISEFTTVTVSKLAGGDSNDTKISMKHGGLLASVKKGSSKENFSVVTPTAIAGVRGTTFRVEVGADPEVAPRVKVLDGKVAMAPRIAALDNVSKEQIAASPDLQKLASIEKKEVVLDNQTEGTLDPKVQQQVKAANTAMESAVKAEPAKLEQAAQQAAKATEELSKTDSKPAVEKKEAAVTGQDLIDKATLVAVDVEVLDKVLKTGGTTTPASSNLVDELKQKREAKQEQVMKVIQEEASKKKLTSDKEIEQYYNKLETVVLKDGTKHVGAVIAQTGNILMVHTTTGVMQIEKGKVSEIQY